MVALINVESSLPRPMWAVTRQLQSQRQQRQKLSDARALLSPPTLISDGEDKERAFDKAVATSVELGVLERDGDDLRVAEIAKRLTMDDIASFYDILRRQVLGRVSADDLASERGHTRGKDLLRALCWFLQVDGQTQVTRSTFGREQQDSLSDELGNPLQNTNRWDLFVYWAPALGFAATPLIHSSTAAVLVPDCTQAVRRTVRETWKPGTRLAARELVDSLLEALPVLPGGRYSRALELTPATLDVGNSLANALLRGHDDEWLTMTAPSDAGDAVQLADPGSPGGIRRVTHVKIGEHDRG